MRFRCVNGIVVARRLEARKQIGSIILPDGAQKRSELAVVLECCQGPWREDGQERYSMLKPGDVIAISKYSGQEFDISGDGGDDSVVLVEEKKILCIIDDYATPPDRQEPRNGAAYTHESTPAIEFAGVGYHGAELGGDGY